MVPQQHNQQAVQAITPIVGAMDKRQDQRFMALAQVRTL
jgi:hypothetical protein